jgi:hypothetical protein
LKNASQKRAGAVVQGEGPEFKPQYHTHKKIAPRGALDLDHLVLYKYTL